MNSWQSEYPSPSPLFINVNLSAKQLLQSDLALQIGQILQETSLDARSLNLEITETVIVENVESVIGTLMQLKDLGVRSYVDDFGTGYSCLSYLHRLPIDGLKIDRLFVSGKGTGVENPKVIRTIMTLAGDLGKDVISEGVETLEQLAQLKALECKYVQGYLFSKPMEVEAAEKMIPTRLHTRA